MLLVGKVHSPVTFRKPTRRFCDEFCQSFKMYHFEVANDVSCQLESMLLISHTLLVSFVQDLYAECLK